MKLLREISRIIFIIGIACGLYPHDTWSIARFTMIFLAGIYIYPKFVIFIAKLLKAKPCMVGYQGEILIKEPEKEGEQGQVTFKSDIPIEHLIECYDEVTFLIRK